MSREKRIIFLTYLTKYNIGEIYRSFSFHSIDAYIENFIQRHREKGEDISDKTVYDTQLLASERFEEMKYNGISFVSLYDSNYPQNLKAISQAPPLLYVKGNLLHKVNMAIVGTRKPTIHAEDTIQKYIEGLSINNGVVSGLAHGVDTIAHKLALKNGIYTIGVLPNSPEHIYPKENLRLANDILSSGGAIISELAIGINRGKKSFVERNRLQTGLSEFVVPIEFGIKSGTMHTVNFCIQQKKYLLVRHPTKVQEALPNYEGLNFLLKKSYHKKIILDNNLDLVSIIEKIEPSNPTLF
jgi:DNA protecting protein DprA